MGKLLMVLGVLGVVLGAATPAFADGTTTGADVQVAQTLGERELTVIIRRIDAPGPLHIDVVTHAGTPPGRLELRANTEGATVSSANVDLRQTPGFYGGTLRVDRSGPWELAIDDGLQVATIPFIVPARVSSPWENATYGGFIAAGVLLVAALVLAMFGRIGFAMIPAGGMIAALAVAVTAGLLAPVIPLPPAPGTHLDPTADNVNDPYQRTSIVDFSRPPVNVVAGMDANDMTLRLTDSATGRPVDDLLVRDNAMMHLVAVSPSGGMRHLHPIRLAPGDYRARLNTTESGVYAVAVELARRGGGIQLVRTTVRVEAGTGVLQNDGKADLAKTIQPAGSPSTITANFGTPALQPWLGMRGHMIVAGPITDNAVTAPIWAHVHSMIPVTPGFPDKPDESVAAFGPEVPFTYTFPLPGRYLVWVQAERDYSVITVPTVIDVPEPGKLTARTQQYNVKLAVDNPRLGANTLDFVITDQAGQPTTMDSVTVGLVMSQMGHTLPPVVAVRTEPGRYRAAGMQIPMAGQWQVTVALQGTEQAVFPLLVN
jgi:hypothetical protein